MRSILPMSASLLSASAISGDRPRTLRECLISDGDRHSSSKRLIRSVSSIIFNLPSHFAEACADGLGLFELFSDPWRGSVLIFQDGATGLSCARRQLYANSESNFDDCVMRYLEEVGCPAGDPVEKRKYAKGNRIH